MRRRNGVENIQQNDPTGMGVFPQWTWSWPLNPRVMYNRASAELDGKPWDSKRPGIQWNGTAWVGDVPDYPPTMNPADPAAWLPFIMNGEGTGRLFSSSMVDGPFPEHYEPMESPIANPLHPSQSASPVAFLYDKAAGRPNRFGTAKDYPYVATSYRLTEHEHYVTQHVPALVGLQPSPFVEIPEEVAKEKGIQNGDRVRVTSKRGKLEVLAVVTKRLGGLEVNGKRVYHIGIPIHWGFVGIAADRDPTKGANWLANALPPYATAFATPSPPSSSVAGWRASDRTRSTNIWRGPPPGPCSKRWGRLPATRARADSPKAAVPAAAACRSSRT